MFVAKSIAVLVVSIDWIVQTRGAANVSSLPVRVARLASCARKPQHDMRISSDGPAAGQASFAGKTLPAARRKASLIARNVGI